MNEQEIYDLIERELRPIERQLDEAGRVELDAIAASLARKIHRSLRGESRDGMRGLDSSDQAGEVYR